jgi:hypothetical protein
MPWARLLVVLAVVVAVALATARYRRWQAAVRAESRPVPRLPAELVSGPRTWVVFTTPYCASCGPVTALLRDHDGAASIVTVDATAEPQLAETFLVRSAPTVLLADATGQVQERLVGAEAVGAYVRSPA